MKLQIIFGITILISALFLTSCGVALTPKGKEVRVIDTTFSRECSYVGPFSSTTVSGDHDKVMNHLKNQIAKAGGNAFIVSSDGSATDYPSGLTTYSIAADAYKCDFYKSQATATKIDTATIEKLRALKRLHQEGLLTDDEYKSKKEKIIDEI